MKAEDRFLERLRPLLLSSPRVSVGPGDDAAVVSTEAGDLVATTDLLVESVDFLPDEEPHRLGRRAVAVNLSDLAAMGARPDFFLLSIGFPPEKGEEFPLAIARGALSRAEPFGALLVGGDLSSARATLVSVALWGRPEGRPIRRSGARPGEGLFLSGFPGRAAVGLALARRFAVSGGRTPAPVPSTEGLSPEHERELLAAYRDPEPRVGLGLLLARQRIASAAIDVSDGLGVDAGRLARASGVRAVIERDRIPVSPALAAFAQQASADPLEWILAGGDDYELLFTAPEGAAAALEQGGAAGAVPITRIGSVEPGEGAFLRDRHGDREIAGEGYDHFEARP